MGVPQRTEEGTLIARAMPGFREVLLGQIASDAVKRHVARLFTFPGNPQMTDAAAFMHEIPDGELAEFLAAKSMIEQGGEDGSISNALERFLGGSDE